MSQTNRRFPIGWLILGIIVVLLVGAFLVIRSVRQQAQNQTIQTGEVSLMVGTQEIVYRDPELVARLLRAVH